MGDAASSGEYVVAQVSFSKGDLYRIETVQAFASEALARKWLQDRGEIEGAFGGWPDWTEYRVLRQEGDRYTDLTGMHIGIVKY